MSYNSQKESRKVTWGGSVCVQCLYLHGRPVLQLHLPDQFFRPVLQLHLGYLLVDRTLQCQNRNNTYLSSNKTHFDYCRLVVQYEAVNRDSKRAAKANIKHYSEFCYDKSVSIIPEPAGSSFKFLQGTCVFNSKFSAYYERKTGSISVLSAHFAPQFFSTTTPRYCESYYTQRFATLVGKQHEIDRFSYSDSNIGRGLCSIIPLRVLSGAMKRIVPKNDKGTWHKLRSVAAAAAAAAYGRIKRLNRSNDVPTTTGHRQNP